MIEIEGSDPVNSLRPEDCIALHRTLLHLDSDPAVTLAVLAGQGRNFCGGFDPTVVARVKEQFGDTASVVRHKADPLGQPELSYAVNWRTLFSRRPRKVVIAAVEGLCLDLGLTILGLHSDIRVAAEDATFGWPAIHAGTGPGLAMVSRLEDQVPARLYEWMLTTGWPVDARAAYEDCLVSEVVEPGQARVRALEIAQRISESIGDPSPEKTAMLSGVTDD